MQAWFHLLLLEDAILSDLSCAGRYRRDILQEPHKGMLLQDVPAYHQPL
jgi:hypothetical protein